MTKQWMTVAGTITAFIIAQGVILYTSWKTINTSQRYEELKLVREMYNEFKSPNNILIRISNSVENCNPVYKQYGGNFSHIDVNLYLNFFSDLGDFLNNDFVSLRTIKHYFGAHIVEADKNPYLQKYISELRKNFSQPGAFIEFTDLAERLEQEPEFQELVATLESKCGQKSQIGDRP